MTKGKENLFKGRRSKFSIFSIFALGMKKKYQLKWLKDKNGVWNENIIDMREIIIGYFFDFFESFDNSLRSLLEWENVHHNTKEQNDQLIIQILNAEVKLVLPMHPGKSPGHDALSCIILDILAYEEFFNT